MVGKLTDVEFTLYFYRLRMKESKLTKTYALIGFYCLGSISYPLEQSCVCSTSVFYCR